MNIECPECDQLIEFDCGELPDHACDSTEVTCKNDKCEHVFLVGWYATAELR